MPITYQVPSSLTPNQKKALAALLACAPCCGGSGSGSGFDEVPCCGAEFIPTAVSWEITGISCGGSCLSLTDTAGNNPACQYLQETLDPAQWQYESGFASISSGSNTCDAGGGITITTVGDICCFTRLSDNATVLWLDFSISISDGVNSKTYRLNTYQWDVGSCDGNILEIINRELTLTDTIGTLACTITDPRLTLVYT